jgi:hypothetical protein
MLERAPPMTLRSREAIKPIYEAVNLKKTDGLEH